LAAIGETISERGGVLNLGIEGAMLAGAFAAALASLHAGAWSGAAAAIAAGVLMAAVVGVVAVGLRSDQIITGTAVTLAATGLTGLLAPSLLGAGGALGVPTLAPVAIPGLARIPGIGPV